MLSMKQPFVRYEVLIVILPSSSFLPTKFPSPVSKYVISIASKDTAYKLKLKNILIYFLYFQIIHKLFI